MYNVCVYLLHIMTCIGPVSISNTVHIFFREVQIFWNNFKRGKVNITYTYLFFMELGQQAVLLCIVRCCYITVDSASTTLQNGACAYRCISKQMHYKTPFSHMKSLEIYENYTTLFCLGKINFFTILYYCN